MLNPSNSSSDSNQSESKSQRCPSVAVSLGWLLALYFIGSYLFFSGFFLTRFELEKHSSCDILPQSPLARAENVSAPDRKGESANFTRSQNFILLIAFV